MKKRVRVYKPGGQKSNQPTHEDIVAYVSQRMSADDYDGDTDALKEELANAGISEDNADEYITSIGDELGLNNNEPSAAEQEQLTAQQEQAAIDEEQALLAQQEAAEEARKAQLAAMYDTNIDMSTTEDTAEDEENYMRQGGTKPSKRSFIKQYTKFAKMARGGDTPTPGSDDIPNGREELVNGFQNAIKGSAQDAAMRQEAEARFNSAYGAPQVGAFQEGGIQQEQVDFENPYHHIGAYAAGLGDIFRNNQNIQNDAPQGQLGGFTDTDSGLYKFIGGGDNESADEEYQDSDIDFNQEQYQMGGFRMPKKSGRQYIQAVGSPYYTTTGQAVSPVDLANRKVTSVNVTKRGLLGRPKAYTVNYDGATSATPTATPTASTTTNSTINPTGEQTPPIQFRGNRQPVADWMMRSGIPGIKQMGARMTRSGVIPEIPQGAQPTNSVPVTQAPASNEPYYPPMNARAQRREVRDDAKLNRFLGNKDTDVFNDPKEVARIQESNPGYVPFGDTNKAQTIANQASSLSNKQKEYGGDIAVPELYRAVDGVQTFDPNANPLGTKKDYKGDTVDFTGKVIKKRDPNFSIGEGTMDLKVPGTIDNTYTNPLTGDKPGVIMNEDGAYTDNKIDEEVNPKTKQGTSEDYLVKKNWDKTRDNFNMGMMAVNAGLDIADKVNARKQENKLLENTTSAEANYGISNADNRGNYDPNSGLFRPDQMGSNAVVKYGGGIYATGGSTEDEDEDVQYMTQEEIDEFIANGGELEYV